MGELDLPVSLLRCVIFPLHLTVSSIQDPTSINALLYENMTCLPPAYTPLYLRSNPTCFVGGYPTYSVNVSKVGQIQLAVNFARERNLRLVIKNTGHDFLAKSTGKGALSIWTHHLKWSRFYPEYESGTYRGPAFKLAAGIQVFEANQLAKEHNVTLIGGEGAVRTPLSTQPPVLPVQGL